MGSYNPKMVHAGDYPVVTDSGTVAEGETILELMPVVLGTDGKLKAVTSDTVANVYGLATGERRRRAGGSNLSYGGIFRGFNRSTRRNYGAGF